MDLRAGASTKEELGLDRSEGRILARPSPSHPHDDDRVRLPPASPPCNGKAEKKNRRATASADFAGRAPRGDATVLVDVEKVLDGELADKCFTDSPYNVDYANSAKDKLRGKDRPILNDNLGEEFGTFLHDACVNILT
jgi:hypothetical protein